MLLKNKPAIIVLLFVCVQISSILRAEEPMPQEAYLFLGEIKGDDINIRSDSTVSAEVVSKVDRGEVVEVIAQLYDWYKIRLPYNAPSFIKKDFVVLSPDAKTAKVLNDFVNIRLKPDVGSAILGRLNQGDLVDILEDKGGWYRIRPTKSSFAWVHKNFVGKAKSERIQLKAARQTLAYKDITIVGQVKPKAFTRLATHKLIAEGEKTYLLKADIESLNPFNNRRVKITGKLPDPAKQKYPVIEVEKIEALD